MNMVKKSALAARYLIHVISTQPFSRGPVCTASSALVLFGAPWRAGPEVLLCVPLKQNVLQNAASSLQGLPAASCSLWRPLLPLLCSGHRPPVTWTDTVCFIPHFFMAHGAPERSRQGSFLTVFIGARAKDECCQENL